MVGYKCARCGKQTLGEMRVMVPHVELGDTSDSYVKIKEYDTIGYLCEYCANIIKNTITSSAVYEKI